MADDKSQHVAMLMQYLMKKELEGLSLALFTRVLKWSLEDVQVLLARVRADMSDPRYELYYNVFVSHTRAFLFWLIQTDTTYMDRIR